MSLFIYEDMLACVAGIRWKQVVKLISCLVKQKDLKIFFSTMTFFFGGGRCWLTVCKIIGAFIYFVFFGLVKGKRKFERG